MLAALFCSTALALLLTVLGAPLAAVLRGPGEGWAAFVADALAQGTVFVLLAVAAFAWLGPVAFALTVGAYLAVIAWSAARDGALRPGLRPVRLRVDGWTVAVAVAVGFAIALRLRYINIIPWTGDMGGYVNWANQFVRSGQFRSGFPPLFPIWLSVGGKLFGIDHTAATTPLLGILLIVVFLRLCGQLRVPMGLRLAFTAVLAVQIHALWFSGFPASESLHAPLMLVLTSLLVSALRARSPQRLVPVLFAIAAVSAALSLNRANTILLAFPLIVLLLCCLAPSWTRYTLRLSLAVAASLAGIFVGYVYGIRKIAPYYVGNQLSANVPKSLFRRLDDLGFFRTSTTLFAVMLVSLLLVLGFGWLVDRRWHRSVAAAGDRRGTARRRPALLRWPVPLLAVTALAVLAVVVQNRHGEVPRGLSRIGLWLPALAMLGVLLPATSRRTRGPVVLFSMFTAVGFLALHASRFPTPRGHQIFLYWDRYLFSEVVPMLLVVAAVGATSLLELATARAAGHATMTRLVRPAVALLAVVCALGYVSLDRTATRYTMFAGAYDFEHELADLVPTDTPVLWSATSPQSVPHIFPNSFYAFGQPMALSFGRRMLNVGNHPPFVQDQVIGAADIRAVLTCGTQSVYVIDVVKPNGPDLGARARAADFDLQYVGTASEVLPTLAQPQRGWAKNTITAQVWKASVPEATTPAVPNPRCPTR